jgi:tetratricopeptide (TPR) repeat protein
LSLDTKQQSIDNQQRETVDEMVKRYDHIVYELRKNKQYRKCLPYLNRMIELKESANVYISRGIVHFMLKDYENAINDYDRAIKLDSNYVTAYIYRGNAYRSLKEYEPAIEDYSFALELNSGYTAAYINRADAHSDLGDAHSDPREYSLAINDYKEAIKLAKDYTVYIRLGDTYSKLQQYHEAIEVYSIAISLDGHYDSAYIKRGNACLNLGKFDLAIDNYNLAITLNPKNTTAIVNRGNTYLLKQEYWLAIGDYKQSIALDPQQPVFYNNQGLTYKILRDYQQAIDCFDKAIELKPQFNFYDNKGQALMSLKKYKQAIDSFDHCIALNPSYSRAYFSRATAYLHLNNGQAARDNYVEYSKLNRKDISALWMMEWIALCDTTSVKTGIAQIKAEVAKRLVKHAAINPHHYVAYLCNGVASGLSNKPEESLQTLGQAIRLEPDRWDGYFWKCIFLAYQGQNLAAKMALDKIIALEMPHFLLLPLHWLKLDKPYFYYECCERLLYRAQQ